MVRPLSKYRAFVLSGFPCAVTGLTEATIWCVHLTQRENRKLSKYNSYFIYEDKNKNLAEISFFNDVCVRDNDGVSDEELSRAVTWGVLNQELLKEYYRVTDTLGTFEFMDRMTKYEE